jgi:hypothetical protein
MSPGHFSVVNRVIFQHRTHKAPIQHNHVTRVCTLPDASYRFQKIHSLQTPFLHISSLSSPSKFRIPQILETHHLWQQLVTNLDRDGGRKCFRENNTTSDIVEDIVSPSSEKKRWVTSRPSEPRHKHSDEARVVTSTPQCHQHIEGSRNPLAQISPYQIRVSCTKMGSKLNPVADPYSRWKKLRSVNRN